MKFKCSSYYYILAHVCDDYYGMMPQPHEHKLGRMTNGAAIARSIETTIREEINES
jgi:hypothetical protein